MLSQKLPDSAVVRIRKLDTVAKKWELVSDEFTRKGLFARADMQQTFMESKCPRGMNVRRWLTDLGTKREELVTSGIMITDTEYRFTILSSIPEWLRTYATAIQASASVKDPTFEIEPDVLTRMLSEEFDRVSIGFVTSRPAGDPDPNPRVSGHRNP
jgi:gag-polypeptide of LTR copia-type